MQTLNHLFERNKKWATNLIKEKPDFFEILLNQQSPEYLWIGCSDSRVPANEIVNLQPGELFVHRNVANLVKHSDMNLLSVLQYSVEILKVKHIIVCGHHGCGGVMSAMEDISHGLVDNWIRSIRDIYLKNTELFENLESERTKVDTLCELNVMQQVYNVCQTTIVQDAWKRKQDLSIHGWIYDLKNGLLNDLNIGATENAEIKNIEFKF